MQFSFLGGGWCDCCSTVVGGEIGQLGGGVGSGWLRESKRNRDYREK